jgi:hypothetical protein
MPKIGHAFRKNTYGTRTIVPLKINKFQAYYRTTGTQFSDNAHVIAHVLLQFFEYFVTQTLKYSIHFTVLFCDS